MDFLRVHQTCREIAIGVPLKGELEEETEDVIGC